MTRKMVRDDPDEKKGWDVQVRDGFGATSPGTRMVPCWLVWRLYKPKSKTDPICGKQDKKSFWSEKSRYQGPKCPVTHDACFHDLHDIKHFFSL